MRDFLASSIGVACTAALVIPLSVPASASAVTAAFVDDPAPPGSTQSVPLVPLGTERAAAAVQQGLARRDVKPFSLVGVVWDDPHDELHGTVQVRTRATGTTDWSDWQNVETHNHEHAADPGTPEGDAGAVRGSTAPLWVGDSDGVELRVRAEAPRSGASTAALPRGLRAELVDPGDDPVAAGAPSADDEPAPGQDPAQGPEIPEGTEPDIAKGPVAGAAMTAEESASSAVNADLAAMGALEIPELTKAETEAQLVGFSTPYVGPRPRIVTRKGWGADESLRARDFIYTTSVQAAFVHHSATGNNYTCAEAPSVLRGIYRYHVQSSGWRDFGYNFAVDKCGNIYEGRAGGVAKAVMGAHTLGFNTNSMGIAVLGTYGSTAAPASALTAVAKLTAWKLGLYGKDPRAKTTLTSGGGNLYAKGKKVSLNTISGHRDGFATECPGALLYDKLGTARTASAKYQGRP
ncbi:peptidoglycan recognition protein family protein [Streptomyces sp. SP18CS02]|uniref:peptidoglycan recognition protein family protein n=1 Tax=Streptomyces sp. SP18CS02 TaxID=3002531 RepID=UPI002E76E83B|nr:N-acetylmuramoyl-L-alanine amidase [Streptomyces sp. SP18CS02]MEE1755975.1 N-acetylmuramoyl-L-alanine amidase [Streptomyces sp. SP18CS02]